ncbi:MAG: hypothetical protein KGJ41_13545 [Rhodospirillales bacterium]|nr:hypothetical protein [Rhodospirillales bacterium]
MMALRRSRRASVSVFSAMMLPALAAMAGLAVEYGNGLLTQSRDQRIADAAAYGAALAYAAAYFPTNGGLSQAQNAMVSSATTIGVDNGVAASAVAASLVASPTNDGSKAVLVTITSSVPKTLSSLVSAGTSLTVDAGSYVELKANPAACITALSGSGTGVAVGGGANVSAPKCAIASASTVSASCNSVLTTPTITYDTTAPTSAQLCGVAPPPGVSSVSITKRAVADPLAGNTTVSTLTAHGTAVAGMTAPSAPVTPAAPSINFDNGSAATIAAIAAAGCVAAYSSSTWTVTCVGNGPFDFGNVTLSSGIKANFNTSGAASATYNFDGQISASGTSGSALTFGPGTFNIAKGISSGGSATITFGAGTFNIGPMATTCGSSGAYYSICNSGLGTNFAGQSDISLTNGIFNSGGSTFSAGSGTANSYQLGRASNGDAITLSGGAATYFADASGAGDLFTADGNLNLAAANSCTTLPAAANHDINGFIATKGGVIFGAGIYTVTGYVALGTGNGGNATCSGASLGVVASNVTFVVSGTNASGNSGNAFSVGGGYSTVTMTAPTSGPYANLLVIGPTAASGNTAGTVFAGGASGTSLSGAFYSPIGNISLSGSAGVGSGSGQCLELIGSQVAMSGGSAVASTCAGLGGFSNTGFTVGLVQ